MTWTETHSTVETVAVVSKCINYFLIVLKLQTKRLWVDGVCTVAHSDCRASVDGHRFSATARHSL